jgi:hypothetical protein
VCVLLPLQPLLSHRRPGPVPPVGVPGGGGGDGGGDGHGLGSSGSCGGAGLLDLKTSFL